MKVDSRDWRDVEKGNQFVKTTLETMGKILPENKEEFKFNGEPENRKEFLAKCLEILEKAKEFFVLVVDGIDIPEENRRDYNEFFQCILKKEGLTAFLFTSDIILRGQGIFHDFQVKSENKENLSLFIDERLQPGRFEGEPFGMGGTETVYPKRFVANEKEMVYLKP